jgi:threonine dehydrogenase-like Zn-dependent dehydrogenase
MDVQCYKNVGRINGYIGFHAAYSDTCTQAYPFSTRDIGAIFGYGLREVMIMKALVLEKPMFLEYRDVADPVLSDDRSVLVRLKVSAICGSDVHGMDGSTGRRIPPIVMGHEASGVVEEIGKGVKGFAKGDRVTFDSTIYCGECFFCRRGQPNLCDNRRVLGVSCADYKQDGTFAELVVVPERILYRLPESLDFISASLTEPLSVAAHAARIGSPAAGDSLLVVGAGLIGLLLLQVLRANCSGPIIAVDMDSTRLATARRFGADHTVLAGPDAVRNIQDLTQGRGADQAFEAVGATAPVETAVQGLRKGGTLTLIGNASPRIELPLQSVVTRQLTLKGSCAISGEYPFSLDLMASGKVDVQAIVSATAPLSEGAGWFARLYAREPGLMKVVLLP